MITLQSITRKYGQGQAQVHALKGIDLTIRPGELLAIMGPSGSGKSTLLNIIGLLDLQSSGAYLLDGKPASDYSAKDLAGLRNSRFGFVIQNFSLIDHYTVYQNVAIPLNYSIPRVQNKRKCVSEMLIKLGIEEKMTTLAGKLSGGQKQRVAIARALINDPDIILADEPTGSLDQQSGQAIMDILKQIHLMQKTVVIVTHNRHIAGQCQRIIQVVDGQIVK